MNQATGEQKAICKRFGSPVISVGAEFKVGVAIASLKLTPLNALRHPIKGDTCGWYIWGGEKLSDDPAFFQPLHASHLEAYCPGITPYLALAPGWRVLLAPDYEDVWFDESLVRVEV